MNIVQNNVLIILDFGSQYTQLIARKVRELGYYTEIKPYSIEPEKFKNLAPKAVIFSGGPASIYETKSPRPSLKIMEFIQNNNIALLGICYGMQLIIDFFGGIVEASTQREFGSTQLNLTSVQNELTKGLLNKTIVWMSHGDKVITFPDIFYTIAKTKNCEFAAIFHKQKPIYGLQFHPEVYHTKEGTKLLNNFCELSKIPQNWSMKNYSVQMINQIRETVGQDRVLLGLSGGVDSMVTAKLISKAIGAQLTCVYVDNGLMRNNETEEVLASFKKTINSNLEIIQAGDIFLNRLKGITDPEEKRKIIGRTFIDEFNKKISELGEHKFIAQGTLYPDIIESVSTEGPSDLIKSHHNRVGEVLELLKKGKIIEPLKELFKDEVRELGKELKLPHNILFRHPFPGPGLAIRIIGPISLIKLDILRQVDQIFIDELKKYKLYEQVWQAFAVLLPIKSVGVMGDKRTYQNVVAIRAVESKDGMTANFARLPFDFLSHLSTKIINEISGVNRVVYDISSKPPATIEWE